jgi:hypothetical protein
MTAGRFAGAILRELTDLRVCVWVRRGEWVEICCCDEDGGERRESRPNLFFCRVEVVVGQWDAAVVQKN